MPRWAINFNLVVHLNDPELLRNVATAHAVARTVRDIPVPPYVQQQLHKLNIIRAVRGTTGIEGMTMSESEVREALNASKVQPAATAARRREQQEVLNAQDLMTRVESILRSDPQQPITRS